jgi:hypothetical protein
MKALYSVIQSFLKSNKSEFYYLTEEQQFEESIEASRLRYLTSYDRAA